MNVDQAALMETDNLRPTGMSPDRTVRLKLAERPDRDPESCGYEQLEEVVSYDLGEVLSGGH